MLFRQYRQLDSDSQSNTSDGGDQQSLIVLARRPRPALTGLARGSLADQVIRQASCPVLAIPPATITASTAPPDRWHAESGPSGAGTPSRAAVVGQAVAAAPPAAAISASPAQNG